MEIPANYVPRTAIQNSCSGFDPSTKIKGVLALPDQGAKPTDLFACRGSWTKTHLNRGITFDFPQVGVTVDSQQPPQVSLKVSGTFSLGTPPQTYTVTENYRFKGPGGMTGTQTFVGPNNCTVVYQF